MVVSLLFSVLLLGHKVGVVNAIVNSVNRRKEIEEVLGQLQGSQSQLSPALVKHARRLTLRKEDGDTVRVWQSAASMGLALQEGCPAALRSHRGASWRVRAFVLGADARSDMYVYGARSVAMAGSACAQEEHRSGEHRPNGRTSACGGALSEWFRCPPPAFKRPFLHVSVRWRCLQLAVTCRRRPRASGPARALASSC